MVYLESNKGIFPKITNGTPTSVQFVNQVTKQKFNPEILRVVSKPFSYEIEFKALALPNGQYDYYLSGDLGTGICQYGSFITNKTEYQQNIKITAYERGN